MQNDPSTPAMPRPRFYQASSRLRKALPYFIRNGPLAIVSASLPGFVNYIIIVYLSYAVNLESAGLYRLLMSYFTLCGLPTLQQSSSVYVRARATGQRDQISALFVSQLYVCAVVGGALTIGYYLSRAAGHDWFPAASPAIALATMLFYPCELFIAHLQAQQEFFRLFVLTTAKWIATLAAFVVTFRLTGDVNRAFVSQLVCMVVIDIAIYYAVARNEIRIDRALLNPFALVRRPEVREGVVLSGAQILPGAVEQVDKLIVGAVFGLKALGIYTLGFSTGRLLYNMLKPSLYVYYRHFVDTMPPKQLLRVLFVSFTLLGAAVAIVFALAVHHVPALSRFKGTEWISAVLFLSYGISIVDAVYSQAYAINKNTNSMHLFVGNTVSSLICLLLFLAASFMPVSYGLIVFAMFYPIRHGAAVAITAWQRRRSLRQI